MLRNWLSRTVMFCPPACTACGMPSGLPSAFQIESNVMFSTVKFFVRVALVVKTFPPLRAPVRIKTGSAPSPYAPITTFEYGRTAPLVSSKVCPRRKRISVLSPANCIARAKLLTALPCELPLFASLPPLRST